MDVINVFCVRKILIKMMINWINLHMLSAIDNSGTKHFYPLKGITKTTLPNNK